MHRLLCWIIPTKAIERFDDYDELDALGALAADLLYEIDPRFPYAWVDAWKDRVA